MGANLQFKRGTTAQRTAATPLAGEPIWDTTLKKLFVGDGTTQGGIAVDTDTDTVGVMSVATIAARNAIVNPITGLHVYVQDATGDAANGGPAWAEYVYDGTQYDLIAKPSGISNYDFGTLS